MIWKQDTKTVVASFNYERDIPSKSPTRARREISWWRWKKHSQKRCHGAHSRTQDHGHCNSRLPMLRQAAPSNRLQTAIVSTGHSQDCIQPAQTRGIQICLSRLRRRSHSGIETISAHRQRIPGSRTHSAYRCLEVRLASPPLPARAYLSRPGRAHRSLFHVSLAQGLH